jgi:hypothetical protein
MNAKGFKAKDLGFLKAAIKLNCDYNYTILIVIFAINISTASGSYY